MPRPFASGSRQAPDPYDQYLEKNGFYRKHIARDSSCLFRTISEQMYDTQLHHLAIRERCVEYMRRHKQIFQKDVDKDIDDYLDELSKPKTYGTLVELRAMAYMYRRNVVLFEAYNSGKFMEYDRKFREVFRIFFTPERHFDSVFTADFIEQAAFCQGLCYEILYRGVFKLPDVMYAVEQMLHKNTLEVVQSKITYSGPYAKEIGFTDGRKFALNTPEESECILDNRILCHFHNANFPQFADNLHHDMHLIEVAQCDNQKITKTLDSLLPEKYVSCVQQLLKDGITPFPYKVAKALDPDIYRNIEFDAWSEMRKEQRYKNWYNGGSNLQVGVKCLVKLGASQNNLYNCHIQEMSGEKGPCLVYVEELAQKRTVPYEALEPLPMELAKPWPLPFRLQQQIDRFPRNGSTNDLKKSRGLNGKRRYREFISTIKKEIYTDDDSKEDVSYQLKQFTSIQHFYPQSYEILAMPLTVGHCGNENARSSRRGSLNSVVSHNTTGGGDAIKQESKKEDDNDLDCENNESYPFPYEGYSDPYCPYPYDGNGMASGPHPFFCMYNGQPFQPSAATGSGGIISQGAYMPAGMPCPQPIPGAGYYSNTPTPFMQHPPTVSGIASTVTSTVTTSNFWRHQASILSAVTERVNYSASKSLLPSGEDLPHDIPTLRYFYNLGYECHKHLQKNSGESSGDDRGDPMNKLASILEKNVKLEKENNNPNQMKSEINNNNTSYNPAQYNGKRFSSRYFNSKRNEKVGYRGNPFRGPNPESYGKSTVPNKNMGQSTVNSKYTSSSNKPMTTNTNNNNVTADNVVVSTSNEQAIQTSPISTFTTNDTWCGDFAQTPPPLFSAQAGPMPFGSTCIPVFSETGESQHGVYVQQPTLIPVPYGVYPVAQPGPPPPPHPAPTYQAFLPTPSNAPPMQISPFAPPPFVATGSSAGDLPPIVVNSDPVENGSYTLMSYSPVYYSPSNGSNAISANGTPMQPGYWYPTAPPQALQGNIQTTAATSAAPTTNVSIPSR